MADSGIVRHRGKITSVYNNARRAAELADEYGTLAAYFWSFKPAPEERPTSFDWATLRAMPTTPTSVRLSKELKKRGWSFVGPTTVYAFMQAMGMVNDHAEGCVIREEVARARGAFTPPGR